jgi:hypothetical protein
MKHIKSLACLSLLSFISAGTAVAGPITKITSISPIYNSAELEIVWETSITGGCNTSTVATTNSGAVSHQKLVAFLLAAFAADASVEVIFGGGCATGSINWIQTVKLVKT